MIRDVGDRVILQFSTSESTEPLSLLICPLNFQGLISQFSTSVLEAYPRTFVVPNHLDADTLFYVISDEGDVSFTKIRQDLDRQSRNIRQGDMFRVLAGTILNLINMSSNQKLQIAQMMQPMYTPGHFEACHSAGYSGVLANHIMAPESAINRLDSIILEEFIDENYTTSRMVLAASGVDQEELASIADPLLTFPRGNVFWSQIPIYTWEVTIAAKNV